MICCDSVSQVSVRVIGSGGMEHAVGWKLSQSPHVGKIYCIPGNGGTAITEKCENINLKDYFSMARFAHENNVSLTVVGPEQPLVKGIVNLFSYHNLRIFGPGKEAAQLEGNKAYAKNFMSEYGVPTPQFRIFTDPEEATRYVERAGPVYVKASGLAGGKGALDGRTVDLAKQAIRRIMIEREFEYAGDEVVIEQYLHGEEASCMALINSDANIITPLIPSQDHKKLGENDTGQNTGGMGAYAPTTLITEDLDRRIMSDVLLRTLHGLQDRGISYNGVIYPGLMISDGIPFVLEDGVRFGDPETQSVMPLLESDLYEVLNNVKDGRKPELRWKNGYAVCVVLASDGYPDPSSYEIGKLITGLEKQKDGVIIFHAGTNYDGNFYTSGGRVLGVTGSGQTIEQARDRAYDAIESIFFDNRIFRGDIGRRELLRI